jgi:hypothetical protein
LIILVLLIYISLLSKYHYCIYLQWCAKVAAQQF